MLNPVLRRLARDQWVRLHGTPRVTVLVGGPRGRAIWSQWLALSGMAGTLLEAIGGPEGGDRGDPGDLVDEQIRAAVARAVAEPAHPIAVVVSAEAAQRWRAGRRDRLAALVDEGWIVVPEEVSGKEIDERRPPPHPEGGDPPMPGGGIAGEARGGRDRGSRGALDGAREGALDGRSGDDADGTGRDARGAPKRGSRGDIDGALDGRSGGDADGTGRDASGAPDRGSRGDIEGAVDGALGGRSGGDADGTGRDARGAPKRGSRGDIDGALDGRSGGDADGTGRDASGAPDRGSRGDIDGAREGVLGGRSGGDAGGRGGDVGGAPGRGFHVDARSLAEATLFEALEATPATAGRFRLNESLAVRFGPLAAEVDLLSRGDRIAIEIDGVHHFADPECYRRDRRKDLLLQTQGFVVVRLLAEDVVRDVRAAVTAVSQALAYRLGEGRG